MIDIQQMITELTRPHSHRETHTLETGRWIDTGTTTERYLVRSSHPSSHTTEAPALVHQLLAASPASSGAESRGAAVSKPAARIEAIDTLMLIDHEAAAWVRRLGDDDPGDTIRCLTRLNGLRPSAKHCGQPKGTRTDAGRWCCPRHQLEQDIRDWWHQARIISGWDTPAYRPFNSCPVCEHKGGLRVRFDSGLCIECRSQWDETTIGLLAEHIREENDDEHDVA